MSGDFEAHFAAEFARSLGRFDWWNVRAEHTPFQWQAQVALYSSQPWGERRADLRAAIGTANLVAAQMTAENATPEWFSDTVQALTNYLRQNEDEPDYEALAKIRRTDG